MGNVAHLEGTRFTTADRPSDERTLGALQAISDEMGEDTCWLYRGAYHFQLSLPGWTLALTPENGDRFRISACLNTAPRSTVWVLAHDDARLAAVAREIAYEADVRTSA